MLTVSTDTIISYDMVISGTIAGLLKVRRATQDIRLTQDLLGHSSPTTAAGYAAWSHDGPTVETLPVAS